MAIFSRASKAFSLEELSSPIDRAGRRVSDSWPAPDMEEKGARGIFVFLNAGSGVTRSIGVMFQGTQKTTNGTELQLYSERCDFTKNSLI